MSSKTSLLTKYWSVTSPKNLYGEAPLQGPTPYPFIYHFDRKRTPFVYLLLKIRHPFHIPTLKNTDFLSSWNEVNNSITEENQADKMLTKKKKNII